MIRLIDREFVRICSFAFPTDSPLPQLSKSLPQTLQRKMPSLEVDADDLVTLRFHLRSRVACIQTRDGVVAWQVGERCKLQISYRQGSQQPHREPSPSERAVGISNWDAVSPSSDGQMETEGSRYGEEQGEHSLGRSIMASPVLEGEFDSYPVVQNGGPAHLHSQNGSNGAIVDFVPQKTEGNGSGDQARRGYVRLELLDGESEEPHTILSADTYSLAVLGRFRLLTESLAGWMRAEAVVINS